MQLFWGIEKKPTIMIEQIPQTDSFKQQLRESLRHETLNARTVRIPRHADVYCRGDQDDRVYFIEDGQIKLRVVSWEGKEYLRCSFGAGLQVWLYPSYDMRARDMIPARI